MNDPLSMLSQLVPEKLRGWLLFCIAVLPYLTRGLHAFVNRGSFRDVLSAIFFGTNTPATSEQSGGGVQLTLKAILAVLVPVALLFAVAGCGSTPQKAAFRTVGATQIGVDAAMTEWGAYVKAFHPPASQEQAVKDGYEHVQKAMAVVCDAGAVYAAAGQTNAPAAFGALQTAIANANTEISDLEGLITSFGVSLH